MQLSIISINHKKPHQAIDCMASLWKYYQKEFEANEFEYIIVDNCSQDDSVAQLQKAVKHYKNFKVVPNDRDAGFGAGNNLGAKHAKGEYILLLNDDTLAIDNSIVKMLAYHKEHPEIGALGGKILFFDGREQTAIGSFYSLLTFTLFILGMQRFGLVDKNPRTIQKVDWIKGAFIMIKKSVYEKINGFDEKIWMYTEDMELCYRIHKLGLSCVFFPDAVIKHKEHGTGNRSFAIINIYTNLPYFYKKHKSTFAYQYVQTVLKLKAIMLIILGSFLMKKDLVETYSKALKAVR